jgi:hypothetical protein
MQTTPTEAAQDYQTSSLLDISKYSTHSLCTDYLLRLHISAAEVDAGCEDLRRDWTENVGPLATEGSCNKIDGNFWALVLPLCKKERMRLIGYVGECEYPILKREPPQEHARRLTMKDAFLYDDMVEFPTQPRDSVATQVRYTSLHTKRD